MSRWLFFPSTGPSLVIHDAFGGTGYVEGRTPDTVNNGNTWITGGSTAWSVSSGYAYMGTATYRAMINPNATTYTVEVETYTTATQAHGIWFRYDGDAANIRSTIFLNSTMTALTIFERVGSSNVSSTLVSGLSGLTNTALYWSFEVDGTSVTYDLSTSSGSVASGSTTLQNSTSNIGVFHNNTGTAIQTHDFKVYA